LRPNWKNRRSGFEAQTTKPEPPVLRPNWETVATGFEAQPGNPCSTSLHVYDVDRPLLHPASRSSGHRVPDLCMTIPGPPHQVSYSCPITPSSPSRLRTYTSQDEQTRFLQLEHGYGLVQTENQNSNSNLKSMVNDSSQSKPNLVSQSPP